MATKMPAINKVPQKVVFSGYYGMQNAGDDAFCVVAAEMARNHWHAKDIAFVGRESHLPALPFQVRGLYPETPKFPGHIRYAPVPAMLRARHVVYVGGSVFHSMSGRHRDEQWLARLGLISLQALGVSVGPFTSPGQGEKVIRHLRNYRRVHVRDAASIQRIRELDSSLPVEHGFDVAVLLPTLQFCRSTFDAARAARQSASVPVVGVSVCRDPALHGADAPEERKREKRIVATLRKVAEQMTVRIRFIVFNGHPRWGDDALSTSMASALRDIASTEVVPYTGDVRDTVAAVGGCHALLGVRLHSAIFAYACDTPFAMVAYHPKCKDFAGEIGLSSELLFPKDGPEPSKGADILIRLLKQRKGVVNAKLPLSHAQRSAAIAFDCPLR